MNTWDVCKEYLTEKVLEECWHVQGDSKTPICYKCASYFIEPSGNRTFDNIRDLHALYSAIAKKGLRVSLLEYLLLETTGQKWEFDQRFIMWLFCVDGSPDDFKERCQMIAKWYKWKGEQNEN